MAMTMSPHVSILFAIGFLLMQAILIDITRGESSTSHGNATHHVLQRKSDRLKRSAPEILPDKLKLRIKYPTGEEMDFNWIKKEQYLANQYLPVITSSNYSNNNVMEEVGEFVFYHDVDKCSAVMYVKKFDTFFGVIGLDYAVTNLPYKFNVDGCYPEIVGEPYITRRAGTPVNYNPRFSGTDKLPGSPHQFSCAPGGIRRPSDSDAGLSNRQRRKPSKQEYYLETLVIVTTEIVEFFKTLYGENQYIQWIVRYYLLYFNAVDMMFDKIQSAEIGLQINIAKIVIEDVSKPFNFMSDDEFQFTDVVAKIREHLKINKHIYTSDSFDHVFISASRPIMDKLISVPGTTNYGVDMYKARERHQFYNAIPITAAGFLNDYVIAVHEISKTLMIETDSWFEALEHNEPSKSIMPAESSESNRCWTWSGDNKKQFEAFFSNNRNRCFLLNKPRSIRPPGVSKFLSPLKQCRCFGYDAYVWLKRGGSRKYVKQAECDIPLSCGKFDENDINYEYTIRPFDGTNCGNSKVCWNRKCTHQTLCTIQTVQV